MATSFKLVLPAVLAFAACLVGTACKEKGDRPAPTSAPASAPSPDANAGAAGKAASPPPAPSPPRHVLLITIDSLRADLPWTGYPRAVAPNLSKLAEGSAVYTNEYALSSYTAKSVAGFMSSHYPSTLYRSGNFFAKYPKSNTFLAEVLSAHGVRTTAWHAHLYFKASGLDQGFDTWQFVPGLVFDAETDNAVSGEAMTELGIKLLGMPENTGRQFFAWAHYMDPHDHYNKHPEAPDFGNKTRDRYDSEVFYADLWLGKLLDFARRQPWWKDTILIVSADHGEAFGEHGLYKHAFEIWEVLTRVPLLVSGPGIEARRIDVRRSHLDLAPTIVDLMGFPPETAFMGKSFAPELFGATPDNREPILSELSEDSHNPARRALVLGDYKLISFDKDRKFMLFNLSRDPGELTDLAASEPAELAIMKQAYSNLWEKLPVVEPFGGATLKSGATARGPLGP